ncbi:EamA family transporter [Sphingobacterium faecale]|uniref:EamA/RhaT family transporter n=1 Tax=Sphingobacterium faecale TaxID=2803775 RepID=A0ABS1R275_9SPHI|nr:EamA/RhaT family transporter [Sphingobacterium faecale]MBL1408797.1 EamA/RhaT family transporter [Sphingobacterium faecale]
MLYVILSVVCSVIVAVLLKMARGRSLNVQQIVLWNYPATVVLTYTLLGPELKDVPWSILPYQLYIPLTILLPTLFIFIALSIKYSGIVKTDVAQRMSLFIPLLASFLIFKETASSGKLIGIAVGLIALVCSVSWNKAGQGQKSNSMLYPAVVFLGMGIIDVLFKQVAQHKEVSYIDSMFFVFVGAMLVAFCILLFQKWGRGQRIEASSMLWGSVLGVFNFFNIFFYMKAHRVIPDNPSIVFTTMNVGVIVVGTLVGVWAFKEKLSYINKIGLVLAVISILLIAYL